MREPIHDFVQFENLKDMLKKSGELYGDKPAFVYKTKKQGVFKKITHKQYRKDIDMLGTALINLGLKNKRVAIISDNRYEWGLCYLAIVTGTGVVVPLDKLLPENEIESLIIRSNVEAIIYSDKYNGIMRTLKEKKNTNIKFFISMDSDKSKDGIYSLKELIEKGKDLIESNNREFIDASINAEEMAIMLFTSGTTAKSKAVMLSHKNIVTNLMDIAATIKIDSNDRLLSFLPLHHTFECTVGFLYPVSKGSSIAFCEGLRHIADNIKEFEITAMISVPILYDGIYKKIMKTIKKKNKDKKVENGLKLSKALLKMGVDLRKVIFKEIHDNLGSKLRLMVAGGAALDPETEKAFYDFGFTMLQGYGLTETSPVIAAEDDKYKKIGSIGKAFPSLDIKVVNPNEDGIGELFVKGPSVMLGYYNNKEATQESMEDGWFKTGDLAKIDEEGYIFITGRKKYVIVLKNGKNIYPEEIESLINKIPGVKESFVYGKIQEDGDYKINAKIVYDKEQLKDLYGLKDEKEIEKKLWKEIKAINKKMPTYKYIKNITVTKEELIKTTTQKIKRFEEMQRV